MNKLQKMQKDLKRIKKTFDMFKKSGLNEEVLVLWIQAKVGLSRKKIKQMLNAQEKFFDELIVEDILTKL